MDNKYIIGKDIELDGMSLIIMDGEPKEIFNPYSGKSCILNPIAIALYDVIKGAELLNNFPLLQRGLHIFAEHWPEEYMILLD